MAIKSYVAVTIALLFVFAAVPAVYAAPQQGIISAAQADLHGPRVNKVLFSVISTDATLYSSLAAGTIQGPEWTFETGSYTSAQTNPDLSANSSLGYTFYGIGFNQLRPVVNTTAFHRAMAYLTDYSFIESTVLSGVAGAAQPDLFPCLAYPTACNTSIPTYPLSQTNAIKELKLAGLTEGNSTDVTSLSSITWLYKGSPFNPKFYYRSDDPLRTGVATSLISNAKAIGLIFNAQGISGSDATPDIYSPSASAAISPGVYNPSTGYNSPPVFNYSAAQSTDTWDMYTFGWSTSADYVWAFDFFNSQNVATSLNFLNFYNKTMDYDTNSLNYASTIQAAQTAAQKVDLDAAQSLPYLMSYYENSLWANYVNGWTGYVNIPAAGPDTLTGIYYTLLNVHPTNDPDGGTYNYAIHQQADAGGMNPLYNTNWIWQADIWGEIYDSPLGTPPAQNNIALALMNWMTTSYSVAAFNGNTGTGPGWFQMQGPQGTANKIVGGDVVTFNFDKNITFTDNTPFTAADYNYSLYAWDLSLPPSLANMTTPDSGELAGPAGLWATYIPPTNPYQIQIYINSSSVWNIPSVVVPVLSQQEMQYFNLNNAATASGAMDTTQPFATATSSTACGSPCSFLGSKPIPTWVKYLPNLEVGSGPFSLAAFSESTGAGQLDKNVNYFRSAWAETATTVAAGSKYSFAEDINESIYNAGSSAMGSVAPGQVGQVPITNATGTVTVIENAGTASNKTVATIPLTGGTNGQYTAAISTTGWAPGTYELVTNANFNFFGLARTWYEASGIVIPSSSTSTTATTTSSHTTSTTTTTTTSSNTDYYILGVVAVVVIIVIAAAFSRRRRIP